MKPENKFPSMNPVNTVVLIADGPAVYRIPSTSRGGGTYYRNLIIPNGCTLATSRPYLNDGVLMIICRHPEFRADLPGIAIPDCSQTLCPPGNNDPHYIGINTSYKFNHVQFVKLEKLKDLDDQSRWFLVDQWHRN